VIVIGIKKNNGKLIFNPKPTDVIESHDLLIAVGMSSQLETLARMADSPC
jgi:K+/H+ antiporter YhaU regulatory subunit KhtT